MEAGPWNSLEVVKLVAGLFTPIALAILGIYIHRITKRVEDLQWRGQKLVEKRLAVYEDLAPTINDLLCYFTYIGYWKEPDPPAIVALKRVVDKKIHLAAPLFSESFFEACQLFQNLCFETYTGQGRDALLRSEFGSRRDARPNDWKPEWESCFATTASDPRAIADAYRNIMMAFAADIGVHRAFVDQPTARTPSGASGHAAIRTPAALGVTRMRLSRFQTVWLGMALLFLSWPVAMIALFGANGVRWALNCPTFSIYHIAIIAPLAAYLVETLACSRPDKLLPRGVSFGLAVAFLLTAYGYTIGEFSTNSLEPYEVAKWQDPDGEMQDTAAAFAREKDLRNAFRRAQDDPANIALSENVKRLSGEYENIANHEHRGIILANLGVMAYLNLVLTLVVITVGMLFFWSLVLRVMAVLRGLGGEGRVVTCDLLFMLAFLLWLPLRDYADWYNSHFLIPKVHSPNPAMAAVMLIGAIAATLLVFAEQVHTLRRRDAPLADFVKIGGLLSSIIGGFVFFIGHALFNSYETIEALLANPAFAMFWVAMCVLIAVVFGYLMDWFWPIFCARWNAKGG